MTFENFVIKQVRNCATHIVAKTAASKYLTYDASSSTSEYLYSYFEFVDEADCGPTTCSLHTAGCINSLPSPLDTYVTLSDASSTGAI